MVDNMYKPNSFKSKEEEQSTTQPEPKKVQKVVSGQVTTKKKSGIQKFVNGFIQEDMPKIKNHLLTDIIIPTVKKVIIDTVEIFLYGDERRTKSKLPGSRVSYGDYYEKPKRSYDDRRITSSYRNELDLDDIVLTERGDAEIVLTQLDDIIATYGFARVADLYDMIGKSTPNHCINNYGWTSLASANYIKVRDGYLLKLPRPMPID